MLKNNGDGTFADSVNYAASATPRSVFVADLDGDGDADLAVANQGSDSVSALINCTAPPCACPCHRDPQCDSVTNVYDVVLVVNVAFRGEPDIFDSSALCPWMTTDVDCDRVTKIHDIVRLINVAFRSADLATEFCDPCGM